MKEMLDVWEKLVLHKTILIHEITDILLKLKYLINCKNDHYREENNEIEFSTKCKIQKKDGIWKI